MALAQKAGRGRQGREWVSHRGNFFGSSLVALQPGDPATPSLSLAAGLALIEAVDTAAPNQPLMLKWPNDLLLQGKKLAGILLERSGDRVVAGFGVNLAVAPDLPEVRTASLGAAISPEAFAPLIAARFARLLALWRSAENTAARPWLAWAHPIGTPLAVHTGKELTVSGTFAGIDPDGALRLRHPDGAIEIVRAADVFLSPT